MIVALFKLSVNFYVLDVEASQMVEDVVVGPGVDQLEE